MIAMSLVRRVLKTLIPASLRAKRYEWQAVQKQQALGRMSVAETFTKIYTEGLWGDRPGFDSGPGSRDHFTVPYAQALVEKLIRPYQIKSLCDVGCGDFDAGRHLTPHLEKYIGVDVVPPMIEHHQKQYGSSQISFLFLDATQQRVPDVQVCTIRQVLQHLTTKEIFAVLKNCSHIPYLVITEHLYTGADVVPNKDILHGVQTRSDNKSGVFLEQAPFNLKTETLLEMPYAENAILRTSLIRQAT